MKLSSSLSINNHNRRHITEVTSPRAALLTPCPWKPAKSLAEYPDIYTYYALDIENSHTCTFCSASRCQNDTGIVSVTVYKREILAHNLPTLRIVPTQNGGRGRDFVAHATSIASAVGVQPITNWRYPCHVR